VSVAIGDPPSSARSLGPLKVYPSTTVRNLDGAGFRHAGAVPELPEVETVRRQLAPLVAGRHITEAWGHPSPKFSSAVEASGARIGAVGRRGKYLLVELDDARELVIHLGMTGQVRLRPDGTVDPFVRAWWALDDGSVLELRDVRRFGRIRVVVAGEYAALPTLLAQGPEPWDVALEGDGLWRALRRSKVRVKTQLLSQRPLAGVGNIYADEALWRAGIHPARRSVTRVEAARLLLALREVLEQGIANGGTTLRDYRTVDGGSGRNQLELGCYGRAGEPCGRCGDLLRRSVIDARGTTHCPTCQPRR
jgi:formamidopyrimidine-DNA glycosylase